MSDAIEGKVALITGGGTGIGAAAARDLAALGAKVAIMGRRQDKLDGVATQIRRSGGEARVYVADVTHKELVAQSVHAVSREFGRLDALISNAGLMPIRPLSEVNTDEWDQMIDVNLRGLLYGVAAALPLFNRQGSGHFINLGSVAGAKVFAPGGVVYSATKFAVHAISEGLRAESGGRYRVTTIAPGAVDTDLKHNTTGVARDAVLTLYEGAIGADAISRAIVYALQQPPEVNINEIMLRPTTQDF